MSELRITGRSLASRPAALDDSLQGLHSSSHVILDMQSGDAGSGARLRHLGEALITDPSTAVYTLMAALAAPHEGHRALRLSVRGLSAPLLEPPAELLELLQQSEAVEELTLEDVSIDRLAQDGAGNLLRTTSHPPVPAWPSTSLHTAQSLLTMPATPINNSAGSSACALDGCCFPPSPPAPTSEAATSASCTAKPPQSLSHVRLPVADEFRARGTGLLRLAAAVPSLRRLSVRGAAFPAAEVVALAAALPQLEELSLDGAMEVDTTCPAVLAAAMATLGKPGAQVSAAAATAAAASQVFKQLLAALPRLRLLRLPMPLAAPQQQLLMGDSGAAARGAHLPDFVPGRFVAAAGLAAPLHLLYDSDDDDEIDCYSHASTFAGNGGNGSGRSSSSSIFSSWGIAGASATSSASSADGDAAATASTQAGSWHVPNIGVPGSAFATHAVPLTPHAAPSRATAAATAVTEADWRFPHHLAELSVPMCAANGPVLFAALAALGEGSSSSINTAGLQPPQEQEQQRGCLRALHVPCPAGYSPWDGAFLKTEQDFAALAGLAPRLEVLHLCLPPALTAPAAAGTLRACLSHLSQLRNVKELRVSEAKLPACFSVRKHQPTPAEYPAAPGVGGSSSRAPIAAAHGAALLPCLLRRPLASAFTVAGLATGTRPAPAPAFGSPAAFGPPPQAPVSPVTPPPPRRLAPPPVPSPVSQWQQPAASGVRRALFSCAGAANQGAAMSRDQQTTTAPAPAALTAVATCLALGSMPPLPALPQLPWGGPAAHGAGVSAPSGAAPGGLTVPLPVMAPRALTALMSGPSVFAHAPGGAHRSAARALSFGGPLLPAAPAPAMASAAAAAAAEGAVPSDVLLSQLLLQWPRLEYVAMLGHSVVRASGAETGGAQQSTAAAAAAGDAALGAGGRLVAPSSLEEMVALRRLAALRGGGGCSSSSEHGSDDEAADGNVSGDMGRGSRRTRSLVSQLAAATMSAETDHHTADAHSRAAKRRRNAQQGHSPLAFAGSAATGTCGCIRGVCGACGRSGGGSSSSASGGSSCGSGDEANASEAEAVTLGSDPSDLAVALAKRCNCCA
ncbi:hypothetical protein HYH02_008829 [Chlamydomonas schloesseri]|uniref:Uncharacterized protein n=1 Tax=Chlamydomonas schloesseri TaxID=2026947 RepID=A0A835WDA2_9CHLO|nr:hypothetical protein HYH02_008829 [Chlamydomonas schloesseri]|eukprot:KAG2445364.1 hypothetical protein HYH02_008829 [Chlamydomonas schloesseri]